MTEIDEIRAKYETGQLEYIKSDLERFIVAHAAEIEQFKRDQVARGLPPITDDTAIKFFIIQNRSINPEREILEQVAEIEREKWIQDRKSTRLNSSHSQISYAVFCLKKKNIHIRRFFTHL